MKYVYNILKLIITYLCKARPTVGNILLVFNFRVPLNVFDKNEDNIIATTMMLSTKHLRVPYTVYLLKIISQRYEQLT